MYPPRMSAAEFALIANTIHQWRQSVRLTSEVPEVVSEFVAAILPALQEDLALTFATALARTNSNFDRDRFLTAATTGQNVKPGPRA